MMILTVISIFAITCVVWMVNKLFPFKICPICAGVSGTWLWMLGASFFGYEIDFVIVAMLLGGSVVGIAYQLEKRLALAKASAGKLLLWKVLFIPVGFVVAYSVVTSQWATLAGFAGVAGVLAWVFLKNSGKQQTGSKVEELKKKMENCC